MARLIDEAFWVYTQYGAETHKAWFKNLSSEDRAELTRQTAEVAQAAKKMLDAMAESGILASMQQFVIGLKAELEEVKE